MKRRSFLASLAQRVQVQGRSADREQLPARGKHRALALAGLRHPSPEHPQGAFVGSWDGDAGQPQRHPSRPPLHMQTPAAGVQSAPHLPGRIAPTAWDGEPGAGAPNVQGEG